MNDVGRRRGGKRQAIEHEYAVAVALAIASAAYEFGRLGWTWPQPNDERTTR